MLHLRYSAGFLICFDFRIYQSSEYSKFWICQGYTRFWIKYFLIEAWQYSEYGLDSEYVKVLNPLMLLKAVSKIFNHSYLTGFWICLEFWIYHCYTRFCRKQPGLNICKGREYAKVLCKLYFKDSQYFECFEFWTC